MLTTVPIFMQLIIKRLLLMSSLWHLKPCIQTCPHVSTGLRALALGFLALWWHHRGRIENWVSVWIADSHGLGWSSGSRCVVWQKGRNEFQFLALVCNMRIRSFTVSIKRIKQNSLTAAQRLPYKNLSVSVHVINYQQEQRLKKTLEATWYHVSLVRRNRGHRNEVQYWKNSDQIIAPLVYSALPPKQHWLCEHDFTYH